MEGLLHIGPVLVRLPWCGATTQDHWFFVVIVLCISDGSTIDRTRGPMQLFFVFVAVIVAAVAAICSVEAPHHVT
jgi:hypothetical protein